ncbi:MAG: methyltransferase domain-containing protein, partial [Oscillospiraceae bacterium]|nr:methyltransferase domain-containing protein [Oscillospiraceae bacterium]
MLRLKCPVCDAVLWENEKGYFCTKGHRYDKAKQNYVNLLMSNKKSEKRHGDDKLMVKARTDFLDKGYYECLQRALCEAAAKYVEDYVNLLDVGCGEGYYTGAVKKAIENTGKVCDALGLDISKEALIAANKRDKSLRLVVGSSNSLPVPDESCDIVMNVFAPLDDGEVLRVLRPGGMLLRAVPDVGHLMGLKRAVYDTAYANPEPEYSPEGFECVEAINVRDEITLVGDDIG